MAVYTVHLPAFRSEKSDVVLAGSAMPASRAADPAATQAALVDAVFLPEGFSRAAFFLGPFWLARHRLWLALAAWLVVFSVLTGIALRFVEPWVSFVVGFLLQILLGLEGNDLRRAKLAWLGYRLVDVAAGATRDDAERSFYRRYFEVGVPPAPAKESPPPTPIAPNPHAEVLGLFPLPEDPR